MLLLFVILALVVLGNVWNGLSINLGTAFLALTLCMRMGIEKVSHWNCGGLIIKLLIVVSIVNAMFQYDWLTLVEIVGS